MLVDKVQPWADSGIALEKQDSRARFLIKLKHK